jgi:hypothetical protein
MFLLNIGNLMIKSKHYNEVMCVCELAIPANVCHFNMICALKDTQTSVSQLKFERVIKNASQSKTFMKLSN